MISNDFYFNGKWASELGISLVKLTSNFTKSPFLADKEILEDYIAGRDKPYYYGVKRKPLKLSLLLSSLDGYWTLEKRREIARWLNTDYYKPLYSKDEPSKQYYCQYIGGVDLKYLGSLQGYIEINFRCNSPHAYSPYYTITHDCTTSSPTIIEFDNSGDLPVNPEAWITFTDTDVTIENTSDSTQPIFQFTSCAVDETIYIDNINHIIQTDLNSAGGYEILRYDNFTGDYLSIPRGVNNLQVTGRCVIQFRWQNKILG